MPAEVGWPTWMQPITPISLLIGVGLPLLLVAVVAEGLWRWWRKERE